MQGDGQVVAITERRPRPADVVLLRSPTTPPPAPRVPPEQQRVPVDVAGKAPVPPGACGRRPLSKRVRSRTSSSADRPDARCGERHQLQHGHHLDVLHAVHAGEHGPGSHHVDRVAASAASSSARSRPRAWPASTALPERLERAVTTSRSGARAHRSPGRDDGPVTAAPVALEGVSALADLLAARRCAGPLRRRAVHRLRHPGLPGRDRVAAAAHADDLPDLHPRPARPAPVLGAQLRRLAADRAAPGPTPGTARVAALQHGRGGRRASSPRTSTGCTRPPARRTSSSCTAGSTASSASPAATSPTAPSSTSGCGRRTPTSGPRGRRDQPRRRRRAARRGRSTGS